MFKQKKVQAIVFSTILGISILSLEGNVETARAASTAYLNKKSLSLTIGKTYKLKVNKLKKGQKVKWSSSKKSIVAVNKAGKITAKKSGSAKITAQITKSGKNVKKLTCKVKVPEVKLTKSDYFKKLYDLAKSKGGTYQTLISKDATLTLTADTQDKLIIGCEYSNTSASKIQTEMILTVDSDTVNFTSEIWLVGNENCETAVSTFSAATYTPDTSLEYTLTMSKPENETEEIKSNVSFLANNSTKVTVMGTQLMLLTEFHGSSFSMKNLGFENL